MDLSCRLVKMKKKMYVVNNLKFNHIGTSSSNKDLKQEITVNRNWHFCWSKFYYYKKNYSYFYGIKKTLPNLLRAIKKYLIFSLKGEQITAAKHKAEIDGLITSYMLRKSNFRPNIKL